MTNLTDLRQICTDLMLAQSEQLGFARLSLADAQALAQCAVYKHWPDGDTLSNFGEPLDDAPCFFLLEGFVSVHIDLPGGRAPIVATVETPGCVFGTDALYLPTQRYAKYVADGDATCALFTTKSIDQLAVRRPDLAYKLLAVLDSVVFRNFRVNVKRLALDASMQLSEKEEFLGELEAAQQRSRVALAIDPNTIRV